MPGMTDKPAADVGSLHKCAAAALTAYLVAAGVAHTSVSLGCSQTSNIIIGGQLDIDTEEMVIIPGLNIALPVEHPIWSILCIRFNDVAKCILFFSRKMSSQLLRVQPGYATDC